MAATFKDPCPDGAYSVDGMDSCQDVPDGYFGSNGTLSHVAWAATSDLACAHGTYSSKGTGACLVCEAVTYAGSQGQSVFTVCAAGSVTNTGLNATAIACIACSPGPYSSDSTVASSTCPRNSETNTLTDVGALECTACLSGILNDASTKVCKAPLGFLLPPTLAHGDRWGDGY